MPQSYLKNINNANVSDASKMKSPNLFQVNFCLGNDVTILSPLVPLYVPVSNIKCSFAHLREASALKLHAQGALAESASIKGCCVIHRVTKAYAKPFEKYGQNFIWTHTFK